MDHTHFGVRLHAPLPIFRGEPDDRLIVRVGHPEPVALVRILPPNYGAIITALDHGLVMPLNAQQHAGELIRTLAELQAEGPAAAAPAVPYRMRWHRHLCLLEPAPGPAPPPCRARRS